jgi:hypothetical protein
VELPVAVVADRPPGRRQRRPSARRRHP